MRYASLLPPLLLALTVAACARQQPAYYVTNSMTGQRVSAGQRETASDNQRGLLGAGETQASGYNSYASAAPRQQQSTGRGLFSSQTFDTNLFQSSWFGRPSSAPSYTVQPQASQTYGARPYGSRTYAPQTYSYKPPRQQAYAQRQATMQYRPPQQQAPQRYTAQQYYRQPQPAGYYTARYGLY